MEKLLITIDIQTIPGEFNEISKHMLVSLLEEFVANAGGISGVEQVKSFDPFPESDEVFNPKSL